MKELCVYLPFDYYSWFAHLLIKEKFMKTGWDHDQCKGKIPPLSILRSSAATETELAELANLEITNLLRLIIAANTFTLLK